MSQFKPRYFQRFKLGKIAYGKSTRKINRVDLSVTVTHTQENISDIYGRSHSNYWYLSYSLSVWNLTGTKLIYTTTDLHFLDDLGLFITNNIQELLTVINSYYGFIACCELETKQVQLLLNTIPNQTIKTLLKTLTINY